MKGMERINKSPAYCIVDDRDVFISPPAADPHGLGKTSPQTSFFDVMWLSSSAWLPFYPHYYTRIHLASHHAIFRCRGKCWRGEELSFARSSSHRIVSYLKRPLYLFALNILLQSPFPWKLLHSQFHIWGVGRPGGHYRVKVNAGLVRSVKTGNH